MLNVIIRKELEKELLSINTFFYRMSGRQLPPVKIKLSSKLKDVEESRNGVITLNPEYIEEYNSKHKANLTYPALLAHGYFHHAQHTIMADWDPNIFFKKLMAYKLTMGEMNEIVNNLVEAASMFFAAAYVNISLKHTPNNIRRFLAQDGYDAPSGKLIKGNEMVLLLYTYNSDDASKTIKDSLTYNGQERMIRLLLEAKKGNRKCIQPMRTALDTADLSAEGAVRAEGS